MVSGSISLPSPGCFSPFPHGTVRYRSLRVVSLGRWAAQLPAGLHVSGGTQEPKARATTLPTTRLSRSMAPRSRRLRVTCRITSGPAGPHLWPFNPSVATAAALTRRWFGLIPVRSPLLRDCFLFLGVHEMVQFPRFPPSKRSATAEAVGLPHSEIVGSTPARGSPTLIAALPRPSSARSAEASPMCSLCLPCRKSSGRSARPQTSTTAGQQTNKIACSHAMHLVRFTWPVARRRGPLTPET